MGVAPCEIRAGDVLCYRGRGLFSWAIMVKTWAEVSHVELANSGASAFASRDGKGVHTYAIDLDPARLYAVLRPVQAVDMEAVRAFHSRCIGQKYDVWGLFRFFTWGKQSFDKQFCSEYVVRLLRHGGVEPFTPETDADLVSPGMMLTTPALRRVWCRA